MHFTPPYTFFRKVKQLYCLFYVKRCDAFNCASMGTDLGKGATFKTPPILLHGLNGIIIGHDAQIGANCVVVEDIPDNATVVLNKPRIIIR